VQVKKDPRGGGGRRGSDKSKHTVCGTADDLKQRLEELRERGRSRMKAPAENDDEAGEAQVQVKAMQGMQGKRSVQHFQDLQSAKDHHTMYLEPFYEKFRLAASPRNGGIDVSPGVSPRGNGRVVGAWGLIASERELSPEVFFGEAREERSGWAVSQRQSPERSPRARAASPSIRSHSSLSAVTGSSWLPRPNTGNFIDARGGAGARSDRRSPSPAAAGSRRSASPPLGAGSRGGTKRRGHASTCNLFDSVPRRSSAERLQALRCEAGRGGCVGRTAHPPMPGHVFTQGLHAVVDRQCWYGGSLVPAIRTSS
jgi:hypothetical protein